MTIEIWRDFTIEAAHRLPNTPPTHKCHRMHGHTWAVRIVVTGPIDPQLGWIVDFGQLDAAWSANVQLCHQTLNEIPGLQNPTTEVIAPWIGERMTPAIAALGATLARVEVSEGPRNGCTWTP